MTIHTLFEIGQRVRITATRKTFTVGQIRAQTLNAGALVLIEYRPNYQTGRNGSWTPERGLTAAGAFEPRRHAARIVIQDTESGRTLWEKQVELVRVSRTSNALRSVTPLEPVRIEHAGAVEMFLEIPELEPLGHAVRVPFRIPPTGAPGQTTIDIKAWPDQLITIE